MFNKMERHREKYLTHEERKVQKSIESQSVIRKQSCPSSVEDNISWSDDDEDETRVDISAKQSQTQPRKLSIGFGERMDQPITWLESNRKSIERTKDQGS